MVNNWCLGINAFEHWEASDEIRNELVEIEFINI